MTTSERIRLIQKLAAALLQLRSEDRELVLSEFKVPWLNFDSASVENIVINRLQQAKGDTLQALRVHLDFEAPTHSVDAEAVERLWLPGYCRCFLSHTSKHKTLAAGLKSALLEFGCDLFVAHEDIEPTTEWLREIENALGSCHCLLALTTEHFHASRWTDQEVGFALGRTLPVVPIRAGADPYGLMGKLQAVPFREDALGEVAETIFGVLNGRKQTAQLIAAGVVQAFLDSESFVVAKRRMAIVERLSVIGPELQTRLREAPTTNRQIAQSFGVPARLISLLGKTS